MKRAVFVAASLGISLLGFRLEAQSASVTSDWRNAAPHVGTTARVLLIGTRPEDDDNGLVAWLSLGRHIETAYLSLTRGESGVNAIGAENEFPLGSVRTAELLAARTRDQAHQYFTRAYDFGSTTSDSVVNVMWPKDSLLRDVVSVVRAFRPHVIIVLSQDSQERDATRRITARLAAEAYALASDTLRMPTNATSRLAAWAPQRLFTRVDSVSASGTTTINMGEFSAVYSRTFAELGADIRRLQRTQGPVAAPPIGQVARHLRLDSTRVGTDASLFGAMDTTLARFRVLSNPELTAQLDSLRTELNAVAQWAAQGPLAEANELAVRLARVARRTTAARLSFACRDESGVPNCANLVGDLAVSLNTIRERATAAMLGAAGLVVDGVVDRQLVAAGDSVPVSVTVMNGGRAPVSIRRVAAFGPGRLSIIARDTSISLLPDSTASWTTRVRMSSPSYYWWQINGLVDSTRLHDFRTTARNPVVPRLISGEDRISSSGVEATIALNDVEVPIIARPLSYRSSVMQRGDISKPLIGVQPTSLLLDRGAEYERAMVPIDRVFRVYVSNARDAVDTVRVSLKVPTGLRADSLAKTVALSPFGARNVFFRVQGTLRSGEHALAATAQSLANLKPSPNPPAETRAGVVVRDYPHIPSQNFIRIATDRIEAVDVRVPPQLRVAYLRGTEDLREPLSQLKVDAQVLAPIMLAVVNLSHFSTILVGAGALVGESGAFVLPALQAFARNGGTVLILAGGDEIAKSGVLPFPVDFGSTPKRVSDPATLIRFTDAQSSLLTWPNVLVAKDFEHWFGYRARGVPATVDAKFAAPLSINEPGQPPASAAVIAAKVGRGTVIYTSLSLDMQLEAAHPGAARIFVNLLSAGLKPAR